MPKRGVMLRTPGSPFLEQKARPLPTLERPAAVRVVEQPDRRGQLRKADRRHVRLVGWWAAGLGSGIGARMMIDGFYSQNGRGPKPKCSR